MSDAAQHTLIPVRTPEIPHAPRAHAIEPQTPPKHSPLRPAGLGKMLVTFGVHILIPLFLAAGMGLTYLGAFHAPMPKDLPVGIVGRGATTEVFAQTITDQSDGALVAHVVDSTATARHRIENRSLTAVYAPAAAGATLYVSSAASETTASAVQKIFMPVAYKQGTPFHVVDVVPSGSGDTTGQGLFFLLVALSVGGYSAAIAVAAFAARLRPVWTTIIGLATSAAVAAIGIVIAGPIFGVITTHQWQIFLFAWFYDAAIIAIGVGLHPILGRWTTPALTLMFVMLNFTSSGGIFQPALQPGFFASLHAFWNGAAWLETAQNLQDFPGASLGTPALVLTIWLAAAILLCVVVHGLIARKTRIARERAVTPLEEEETVAV